MVKARPVHVVPHGDQWAVEREGAQRASSLHDTQADAIGRGRPAAQSDKTELFIHNREGEIRDRSSYGNDPYPPKG